MEKIPQICIGCGAPLHGPICEFCGREYDLNSKTVILGDVMDDPVVEVMFHGHRLKMYVSDIEMEKLIIEPVKTLDGTMHCVSKPVIRFSLISM